MVPSVTHFATTRRLQNPGFLGDFESGWNSVLTEDRRRSSVKAKVRPQ